MTGQLHDTTATLLQRQLKCQQPTSEYNQGESLSSQYFAEPKIFYYVIDPLCNFLYCSTSQELTGYTPEELVGRNITRFIHQDDIDTFVRQFNAGFTRQQFRLYYRFKKKNNEYVMLEVQGHSYYHTENHQPKYSFCLARSYLTKPTSILDAFLQIKMENEILKQQLSELGTFGADKGWVNSKVSENTDPSSYFNDHTSPKAIIQTSCESHNTTDLNSSPTNIVTNSPEQYKRNYLSDENTCNQEINLKSRKKRKQKSEDNIDHMCTECGTVESPEWRKGPQGPKTLCNACGLRWAKRAKRELQTTKSEDASSS
ncbi:GATA-domain-containing protein [Basidiobolus meristosporus CBS 931.73]|uniref:GATA-domain-containing protein n=1 Tax=Basidiobolus meristosporus CBS 931.73 TaxID=1314790 RepID=A0A1Y1YCU9_9FUNG|nr:GATA-domain-containing protein [Basidiobolus meristosporus CBS 931.73]|eukprot:ORX95765.1 GATA-domain-containing protein [Basidiobolus meristosporus CBS 931.73]